VMPFSYHRYLFAGEKLNKTENEREKKINCSFAIARSKFVPRDNG